MKALTPIVPDPRGLDRSDMPVAGKSTDYPPDHRILPHRHPNAQLLHGAQGVMVVSTAAGQWVVPPTRGLWMPAGVEHWIRTIGEVQMRTVYIRPDAVPGLPTACCVLAVSPLLHELILAAVEIPLPYAADSRDGRLMRLLLDEVAGLPVLPLHLPHPSDARLQTICAALTRAPDDTTTVAGWARQLHVDPKTIHRLFVRETGMTFGQWRQQARLLVGLERLAGGGKVLDVALELGYSSPSAFATMFKRQFGVAPSLFFGRAPGLPAVVSPAAPPALRSSA
jgi:AraC-like DNA-binding protein